VDTIDINVDQDDLLDIVLTLGETDSDVSNVEADLIAALTSRGVPEDKIKIQAVESSDVSAGDTTAGWETFDHTNVLSSAIPYYKPYYNETSGNFDLEDHIVVSTSDGTDIDFYGYGAPSYKDFMYMPSSDPGKKIIDFYIEEGEFYDAIDGPGFFINTGMSDAAFPAKTMTGYLLFFKYQTMSSNPPTIYLYSFTNQNVYSFHGSTTGTTSSVANIGTLVATASVSPRNSVVGTIRKIQIEATPTGMQMWYADAASGDPDSLTMNQVTWSLAAGGSSTEVALTDNGSYGFGPMNSYLSHNCSRPTHFVFNDISMGTESSAKFSEVIREPEWRDESKRFIINAEDGAVEDFSDPVALGEILARLGNENIDYIGWGKDEVDGEAFIAKNDGNGVFVDKDQVETDEYTEQIAAIADYIYSRYVDGVQNNTEYLIYGKPSSLSITPESEQTNTADETWPNGKWRVDQDELYYDNPTGVVPYDNLYLNNLDISFTETGKYDVYYKDEIAKTVYVHRKPVAKFNVSVDAEFAVTITDLAYDPDYESAQDKGIVSVVWKYKETTVSTWTTGMPTVFEEGKNYVIKQVVEDNYGVLSDPYYRYVSTDSQVTSTPVAEFKVTPSTLLTYNSEVVAYTDTSYDPQGEAITDRLWKIAKESTEIYTGATPMTDFTGVPADTYKVTLAVKNESGVWSEEVARYITVVRDETPPTAESDTSTGVFTEPRVIAISFSDEEGGSGFSHRYAVVTSSTTPPTEWGSMGTNNAYSVSLNSLGIHYIHYKVLDYAGNETVSYFGPFTITDAAPPSAPSIGTSPVYSDGTWTNLATTVSASGSVDDFTATENIKYEVSVDGAPYVEASSAALSVSGEYTITFKATDESGNSTTASKIVKVDLIAPAEPVAAMTSGGESYTQNTWATQNVQVQLSGGADTGGSGFSKYQYKINEGSWQDGSACEFNTSGEYTLSYRSVDSAGNTSSVGTRTILVDLEAPGEPTIEISPAYVTEWTNNTLTLSADLATDDMTEEENILYSVSIDGVNFTEGNSIEISSEGVHTVYFKVTDEGGNETTVSRTVKIDKTGSSGPSIAMTSSTEEYTENTWATASVQIALSGATDDASGVAVYQYKLGEGTWQTGDAYSLDVSGEYTFYFRSVDNADNPSATDSRTVLIDLEAPETFAINTSVTTIDSIDIDAATTDAMSGMAPVAYRVHNGTEWSEWKETVDETLSGYERAETVIIKVEAKDVAGNVRTIETTVTTLENTPPTANNDIYSMKEDARATVLEVLENDTDADIQTPQSDVLTVVAVSALSRSGAGKLTLDEGVVTFKPAANFNGRISFSYTAADESGAQTTGYVSVTVTAVNDEPIAVDDQVTLKEDSEVLIDVLDNDEDIENDKAIADFGEAEHGMVVKSAGKIKYIPYEDFYGKDSFTYKMTDGQYESSATVNVTVTNVNDAPTPAPDKASVYIEQPVTIDVVSNDSDIDSTELGIASVSVPENGSVEIVDGKLVYTPKRGFVGTDVFTYISTDGDLETSANVTVIVSYPPYYGEKTEVFTPGGGGNGGGDSGNGGEGGELPGETELVTPPTKGEVKTMGTTAFYEPEEGSEGLDTYSIRTTVGGKSVEYQVITNTDAATGETSTVGYGIPLKKDSFMVYKNNELVIDLSKFVDGDVKGVQIQGAPENGQIRIEDGMLIYTPNDEFVGLDGVVINVTIGDEQVPYAATLNVVDGQAIPLFSWWCVVGWVIAAILLLFNYLRHKEYYNEKKMRWILYIGVSVALMLILCWLKIYFGYIVSAAIMLVYIIGNFVFAGLRSRSNKDESEY
jgi:hypothetical protein